MADDALVKTGLAPGPECPPLETLDRHLSLAEDDPLRAAAERHLLECANCTAEITLLRDFEAGPSSARERDAAEWIAARLRHAQAAESAGVQLTGEKPWWRRLPVALFPAAALVALLLVAVGVQWRPRSRPVPDFGADTMRSQAITAVVSSHSIAWPPVAGASGYDVTLRQLDGSTIFHNFFAGPSLTYPPEVDKTIGTGKAITYEIIAKGPNGSLLARSGVRRLEITK